jgi:hypothetical protein
MPQPPRQPVKAEALLGLAEELEQAALSLRDLAHAVERASAPLLRTDMNDPLARRLIHATELALIEHAPGDDHARAAAQKAVVAVLRELVAATGSRLSPARRAHMVTLASQIDAAALRLERTTNA